MKKLEYDMIIDRYPFFLVVVVHFLWMDGWMDDQINSADTR